MAKSSFLVIKDQMGVSAASAFAQTDWSREVALNRLTPFPLALVAWPAGAEAIAGMDKYQQCQA